MRILQILILSLFLGGCSLAPSTAPKFQTLKIGTTSINVEIASTSSTQEQGLSGRKSLPPDQGMLFVFSSPAIQQFWMKDMNFPLDFIWINGFVVTDLTTNVPPPEPSTRLFDLTIYSPKEPVDKVLEVNSGFIKEHKIKIGDRIELLKSNR